MQQGSAKPGWGEGLQCAWNTEGQRRSLPCHILAPDGATMGTCPHLCFIHRAHGHNHEMRRGTEQELQLRKRGLGLHLAPPQAQVGLCLPGSTLPTLRGSFGLHVP